MTDPLFELGEPPGPPAPDTALRGKPRNSANFVSSIWSFPDTRSEQVYRWYGTLPAPLVEQLTEMYCGGGRVFVDPFLGSGATLTAAASLGRQAIGADINPLACLLAQLRTGGRVHDKALDAGLARFADATSSGRVAAALDSDCFAYTRKWFRPDALHATAAMFERIAACPPEVQRLLFVAGSQLIRDVANVDARCTHHLVTKKKGFVDPAALLAERARLANRAVPEGSVDASIQQASATDPSWYPTGPKFLLLHPPYLGVIHYHLIHRLATDLLGAAQASCSPAALSGLSFDHASIKEQDVSTDNDAPYARFVADIAATTEKVTTGDDRVAVIIGDQRYKGRLRHPFTDFIREFEARGFELEENFIWILQNNGGMHVLRRGHFIDHNYILIFRRG